MRTLDNLRLLLSVLRRNKPTHAGTQPTIKCHRVSEIQSLPRLYTLRTAASILVICILTIPLASRCVAIGQAPFVQTNRTDRAFPLVSAGAAAAVFVDPNDWLGVIRAANDLCTDIERVSGLKPVVSATNRCNGKNVVIIGTLGKSALIDTLVRQGKIDPARIAGKWEAGMIQVIEKPCDDIESALVIVGSDKRGTIFGIYELSEQIGVSPWYWWADVPVKRKQTIYVAPTCRVLGPPAVKYRGIFINDEWPALGRWATEKFGGFNHKFYTNVFELILRLKGNFLWPAMWNSSFATDDPLNAKLADEYGIVVSTSHHEPMMRAWKEWSWGGNPRGSWDYSKNAEKIRQYWAEGLRRTKDYEKVITLGMRGDGDEPMSEQENIALLERIVSDQRKLISEIINPDLTKVPQVWALYKEVQGYYERGMRVPDDVILLWCDDNWGNIRRLPTADERRRSGGAGIYYHFDYVGGPRNYKWINTNPHPKVWEQMHLAYQYGATQIWVVNVGDIKPMEIPIEFFLKLAWDPAAWPKERVAEFAKLWAEREFGPEHAAEIADIVHKYTKYNNRRKPELLEPGTFSIINYHEADRVLAEWLDLVVKAEAINAKLPTAARDAFFQLVLYPVKACATVNELYIAAAKNWLYAKQGRASANVYAAKVRDLFKADALLTETYHREISGGKWNNMMSQTHIGYTNWQEPPVNIMPAVTEIELPELPAMGVAIEGSTAVWPGSTEQPTIAFDVFNKPSRWIEVFNKGRVPFQFTAVPSAPWILINRSPGTVETETRIWISLDWTKVPVGTATGTITLIGTNADPVEIKVTAFNPPEPHPEQLTGFIEADGYISIEAAHFTRKTDTQVARWEEIPDYGRTLSGMSIFPVTAPSVTPPTNAPALEYKIYLFSTGTVQVTTVMGPCLNFDPDRDVRIGVSVDTEQPQIITVVPKGYKAGDWNNDWENAVRNSARFVRSTHTIPNPGYHTLKIWMVDPGVVVEKIIIDTGGLKPSYLGPPESFRNTRAAAATQK